LFHAITSKAIASPMEIAVERHHNRTRDVRLSSSNNSSHKPGRRTRSSS
jgi:hypothetical protein